MPSSLETSIGLDIVQKLEGDRKLGRAENCADTGKK
jgi:hypothetical protein